VAGSNVPAVVPYAPRVQFHPFHARSQRWAVLVCHRRAGKTVAAVNDVIARALHTYKTNARYAYIAPFHAQAKQVAWDYLLRYTQNIRRYMNVSELMVELLNGNRIRLYGADNPDALRGIYLDGVVVDEPADMKMRIWTEVLLPALADRQGWAVFIGTPKGRNAFYKVYADALKEPAEWFTMLLKASESRILPQAELDRIRAKQADEDAYQQEFECNFDAAVKGAYFGKIINGMGGRLQPNLYDPAYPVQAAFDLGMRDDTAVWVWQLMQKTVRFVHYTDGSGLSVPDWVDKLRALRHPSSPDVPYTFSRVWLPHDAKARSLQTGRSIVEQMITLGVRPHLVPSISLQNGIQAVRALLEQCYVDTSTCSEGLDLLRLYQRVYDTKSQSFAESPRHDYTSHAADGFRYAALVAHRSPSTVESSETVRQKPVVTPVEKRTLNSLWDDREMDTSLYDRIQ
jgi:phage terminase large subunit